MMYRPEIDGLRALAVLSVIAFHAFPAWFRGGFIGVDIFFVISGFLITKTIFSELNEESFSLPGFFGRRIRRIFPALILVMTVSLVAGWVLLLSDEFMQLGKHIAGGAVFTNNFIITNEAGYFDNASNTKPMLHLWSLAVEEQFYIVWPTILLLAWYRKFNLLAVIFIITIISFAFNLKYALSNPVEIFFWPFGRFWELLSGSILAWLTLYKHKSLSSLKIHLDYYFLKIFHVDALDANGQMTSNLMSFFGLSMLIFGVFYINEELIFPGTWALVPVMGALLVIGAGKKALFNKIILMNPLTVWLGLISYPLYLWHWPILSFLKIVNIEPLHRDLKIAAVLISIFLASITYEFVEKKIRFKKKNVVNIFLIGSMFSLGVIGLLVYKEHGFDLRKINDDLLYRDLAALTEANNGLDPKCSPDRSFSKDNCSSSHNPSALLWGDSYAMHLAQALASSPTHLSFRQQTLSNCNPIIGLSIYSIEKHKESAKNCVDFNNDVLGWLKENKSIEYVIMASPFSYQSRGYVGGMLIEMNEDLYVSKFKRTIDSLLQLGKKPIVISPPPFIHYNVGSCWKRNAVIDNEHTCDFKLTEAHEDSFKAYKLLEQVSKSVPVIKLSDYICKNDYCNMTINGFPTYRDNGHLSIKGSEAIGKKFDLVKSIFEAADDYYK